MRLVANGIEGGAMDFFAENLMKDAFQCRKWVFAILKAFKMILKMVFLHIRFSVLFHASSAFLLLNHVKSIAKSRKKRA